ncbi:MAG: threonylcarbamoyl-AMP synthase [Desulfovibrionaceae bacterium]|nr:threonylcarbamoyl-AMP synthase [Desulfovibrionaceae bacterium]
MRRISMHEAATRLKNGGLVLYPTETFFGIGCRVSDEDAIARVFQVKRRLLAMPLPVILADAEQLPLVAQVEPSLTDDVRRLTSLFWPGPLSVILPARMHISPLLTGGTGHIAVRVSPHPVPGELAALVGEPIVASSANISGQPAVTRAEALNAELVEAVGAVLDQGPAPLGGAPSTLVEPLGKGRLHIHRSGAVTEDHLQAAAFLPERP